MPVVRLRAPLSELAGGRREIELEGSTVSEVLRALEREHPDVKGWILDERGLIREHVNVFVNKDYGREDMEVAASDRLHVIPAISGGDEMTELLVGTKKGLFVLEGEAGGMLEIASRHFAGEPVEFSTRDPRSGRTFACVTSAFYGPKIFYTDDLAGEWQQASGVELPEDAEKPLERLWTIVPAEDDDHLYAGGAPGVLFESRDGGASWELNKAFWEQPTRPEWSPGAGGMCMHSIATWPGDPSRIALAISAVGVWLSDDSGETWRNGNTNLYPRYMPEEAREDTLTLCVHNMHRAPKRPERLFMQFHGGVYRSDDAGESWTSIADGLPSDFGFPMVVDPDDPDSAYVIPLVADMDRTTPDGKVRVYETRDAGETWAERGDGLPQEDAYLTILRQAFCNEGSGPEMGLYFGATSGDVFGSGDAGRTWFTAATKLPPVHSVRAA